MNNRMRDDRAYDPELLARLHQGDEEAFRELYSAYRARLFSFLLRLSGRRDLAEDLCQEVWLRLVTRPPALNPGMPLGPWLYRVARNLYISYLRSREYDATRTAELTAIQFQPSLQPSPWEELAGNETQRRLQIALVQLPLPYRECLLLVAGAGLTPQAAAEVLDLPAPTFRKRLFRAREMLAKRMTLRTTCENEVGQC
jgi:RNA polymerase sigma-70 factor (ECF subfamily)